ncbi:MAG TPA: hypothetical protein VFO79_16820, partial [Xanthomonadales bacterium]|nr:hypothetical protein [Xanthomonadales bacterium]
LAGLAALEQSRLARVARVSFGDHRDTEPAAYRALVESPLWAERWLDLWLERGADISAVIDALVAARTAAPIEELRISGARLAGLDRLLACPAMSSLRHLALVEPEGDISAACAHPVTTLFLMRCAPVAIDTLSPAIEHLILEECQLGNAGIRALARSALRPVELDLRDDNIDIATHVELLGSPLFANTERLRIFLRRQSAPFETEAVKRVLLESPHLSAIQRISLQGLEAFSKEDKLALKNRFGAALFHPYV